MEGRDIQCHLTRHRRVGSDERGHEGALAAIGQFGGMRKVAITHHGGNGAKGFGVMDMLGGVGVRAMEEHRRHESTLVPVGALNGEIIGVAKDAGGFGGDLSGLLQHIAFLRGRDQRAHAGAVGAWVANGDLGKRGAQPFDNGVNLCVGHDDAADCGTFLPRFGGHFALHFL